MKSKEFYIHKLDSHNMMNKNLLKHFDISYFEKGQCILHQGQRLEKLYILVDGKTKSCHTTSNGTTILIAISQGISVIGEIEFLNHRDIINDVYSIEECICLSISILLYQDLLLNYISLFSYLFISYQMSAKPYFIGSTSIFTFCSRSHIGVYLLMFSLSNVVNFVVNTSMLSDALSLFWHSQ